MLKQKHIIALLMATVIGMGAPTAFAQSDSSASSSSESSPAEDLTWAMAALLFVNYNCQAPLGNETYTKTRDLVSQMAGSLANDEAMGPEFVKAAEDIAKTSCTDPNTCWRDYLELDAKATLADATPKCQEQMSSMVGVIQELIAELTGEASQ